MADLTEQIHTKLELVETDQDLWLAVERFGPEVRSMFNALLAVLELHEAFTIAGGEFEGRKVCKSCGDTTDEHLAVDDPCPTKRAIAEQLGIEVDRG